jgi:hypothetical protein
MPESGKIPLCGALASFLIACSLLTLSGAGNSAGHSALTPSTQKIAAARPDSHLQRRSLLADFYQTGRVKLIEEVRVAGAALWRIERDEDEYPSLVKYRLATGRREKSS